MMSSPEVRDIQRLMALGNLLDVSHHLPIGDLLEKAISIFEDIETKLPRLIAEEAMRGIRTLASRAQMEDYLFKTPPSLPHELDDQEIIQVVAFERALHELCFCFEMLQTASAMTWGGSTPTRFYLNSVYHFVSSMFLVDKSKASWLATWVPSLSET